MILSFQVEASRAEAEDQGQEPETEAIQIICFVVVTLSRLPSD